MKLTDRERVEFASRLGAARATWRHEFTGGCTFVEDVSLLFGGRAAC